MLELPECITLTNDLEKSVVGKRITHAAANTSEHKFTFYNGDPKEYGARLQGRAVTGVREVGFYAVLECDGIMLSFRDGVNLRYIGDASKAPEKHQLFVALDDGSALYATVAMYGEIFCGEEAEHEQNAYYRASKYGVKTLSDAFDAAHLGKLMDEAGPKQSAKALLATQQRVIGVGNGTLQDILFVAGIHPKRKIGTMSDAECETLCDAVKGTLKRMTDGRGRDTEKDLFGNSGGYSTLLSKNTADKPCPRCGDIIHKTAYMGGSVYYCETCQKI